MVVEAMGPGAIERRTCSYRAIMVAPGNVLNVSLSPNPDRVRNEAVDRTDRPCHRISNSRPNGLK